MSSAYFFGSASTAENGRSPLIQNDTPPRYDEEAAKLDYSDLSEVIKLIKFWSAEGAKSNSFRAFSARPILNTYLGRWPRLLHFAPSALLTLKLQTDRIASISASPITQISAKPYRSKIDTSHRT